MEIAIKGNSKMGNNVYIFNLPPIKTCTPTIWCLKGKDGTPSCYALRNNFLLPSVIKSGEIRYKISKSNQFATEMVTFIKKKKVKYFRIHSSGDFYSKEYVEKWIEITKNCPETKFRGTTHRRDLISVIEKLNSLPNVIIRESLDSGVKNQITSLSFVALSSLDIVKKEISYHCVNSCPSCGYSCWENRGNVNFDEH
jgi:hypothetical protein